MIGAFVTFTSCKDYDDDINNLEQKIGALSSTLNELKAKVDAGAVITDVTSTPDGVKVTLSDGKTFELTNGKDGVDGQNGKDGKDGEPGSVVTIGENGNWFIDGVDTELPAQGPKGEQGEQGPVGPEGPEGPVGPEGPAGKDGVYYVPNEDGYWYKHDGDEVTKGDLWLLPGVITAVMHDNGDVTFHNVQAGNDTNTFTVYNNKLLRSLVLIPHHYVNGVEAIGFNPLAYLCGGFDCISGEYDELYGWYGQGNEGGWGRSVATRATGEECEIYRANPKSVKVQYFVNPSTITADMIDTENLSFVYKYQENKLRSEDINATATFESLEDGILTVVVDLDANYAEEPGKWDWHQRIDKMDMIALQVPLSEKAANYAPNVEPVITSDWARVDVEDLAWPVIDRKETLCEVDHIDYTFAYPTADAAKAMDDDDTPYMLELVYDKKHDLLDYVTSTALTVDECDEFDPAEYGLVWNFDLLDENGDEIVYKLTSNATDQQEFIKLLDNQGKLEARVYDADEGDGVTDAIGRTPIVRMQLIDPKTECVVTEGFVKIKWVKEHPVFDAEYPAEDVDFSCEMLETEAGYYSAMGIDIKTPWMNTNVMNKIGSYYQEFIEVYDLDTDALYDEDGEELDWGVVVSNLDDDSGDSEVTDLFSVYLKDVCDLTENTTFEGYVHYTHHVTGEVAVRVKVTINVVMPQLSVAGHNNTYWKDGTNTSNVFMVNPVQFGTDSQVNPTANYRTDLLNGFTDGTTYTDDISKIVKSSIKGHVPCDVKFVFDAEALKSYTYDVEGVTYKSTGTNPNLRVSTNGKNLEFNNNGTWTIGAYIKDYNPMPGLTHGGSAIHLNESGQEGNAVLDSWPHKFAKALVGEHVPVKLTADLCCGIECDLSRTIRAFEVYFIPPMHINSKFTDSFVDWVVKGDYISLDKAFTLTDFAGYLVANTADWTGTPANTPEKERYTKSLWDYYELRNVVWDEANATCNIDAVNGDIDVVPGANKPLPVNYEVSYVNTTQNPNSLRFQNNSGAPLAKEFELYVPVTVGHKWGTLKTTVTIKVLPAP